jgi:hypothetical protein
VRAKETAGMITTSWTLHFNVDEMVQDIVSYLIAFALGQWLVLRARKRISKSYHDAYFETLNKALEKRCDICKKDAQQELERLTK